MDHLRQTKDSQPWAKLEGIRLPKVRVVFGSRFLMVVDVIPEVHMGTLGPSNPSCFDMLYKNWRACSVKAVHGGHLLL